jgi:hypothetical protein
MFNIDCSDGKEAKGVMKQIERSSFNPVSADYGALRNVSENQLRENIHKWLSPADPSTNHNIACGTHYKKIANWFFEGSIFREWKSKGSLIWINGKRVLYLFPILHPDDTLLL